MTTHSTVLLALLPAVAFAGLTACRGEISRLPPVHIVTDMDFQQKFKGQSEASFPGWEDGRAMRPPVTGTVARGDLREHDRDPEVAKLHVWVTGKDNAGNDTFVTKNPLPLTRKVLERGRERFDIHCAICHGRTGRGNGPVGLRLPTKPLSYLHVAGPDVYPGAESPGADRMDAKMQALADGAIFNTITNGQTTMPAYGHQIPVRDRWAIVHYVRALQLRVKKK